MFWLSRSRQSQGLPAVAARPTRTAPICSSARLVLRVMPGVGRRCVHCVIVDVEAVPSTNNARFAPRCTEPRLKAGRAGLKDNLGKLRHFMGGLVIVDVEAVPSTNNARFAPRCTEPRLKAGRAGLKDKLGKLRHFMGGLGDCATIRL